MLGMWVSRLHCQVNDADKSGSARVGVDELAGCAVRSFRRGKARDRRVRAVDYRQNWNRFKALGRCKRECRTRYKAAAGRLRPG